MEENGRAVNENDKARSGTAPQGQRVPVFPSGAGGLIVFGWG